MRPEDRIALEIIVMLVMAGVLAWALLELRYAVKRIGQQAKLIRALERSLKAAKAPPPLRRSFAVPIAPDAVDEHASQAIAGLNLADTTLELDTRKILDWRDAPTARVHWGHGALGFRIPSPDELERWRWGTAE